MIYEYFCINCGSDFEVEQRITDKPIKKCPVCGKMKAQRQISKCNFKLKGTGWAGDGYSSSSKGPSKKG